MQSKRSKGEMCSILMIKNLMMGTTCNFDPVLLSTILN